MTAERDIVGLTLPFVAGTAASFFLQTSSGAVSTLSLILISVGLLLLIHPSHKTLASNTLWYIIITLAFLCGLFSATTWHLTSATKIQLYSGAGIGAHDFANNIKRHIFDIPFSDKSTNGLICALITGDRSSLPRSITASFRDSGAAHILALSGLHIGIIYGIIKALLSKITGGLRHSRIICSIITISACGFYTIATGAGASIVRAFIFILLGETASLTCRRRSLTSILMTSLLLHTLIWPEALKSISFQLSYAAMAGIAYIYPRLNRIWSGRRETEGCGLKILDWIWDSAAISISCQITTGPLAWFYFKSIPAYFLITNLIAIPLVGLIIPASLCTLLLHSAGLCPMIVVRFTEYITKILVDSLDVISSF